MTSIPGVDYAWSHPSPTALQKAGKAFVCRYLSTDASKSLTAAEAAALAAVGISCVVVWETTATRALGGSAAGAADAKAALAQATACGMPAGRPIYFAVDFDATSGQQTAINAYLDGAASVIGSGRVGIYGGYYPVKRTLDAGKATWAWQTIAWSGGKWDTRAVIRQGAQATIGGVNCDLNTALADDYGQWTPGTEPDMALTKTDVATFAHTDGVLVSPDGAKDPKGNAFWTLESYQRNGYLQDRETNALVKQLATKLDALTAANAKLVDTVATLAAGLGDIDPAAIVAELKAALENVTVHLDATP